MPTIKRLFLGVLTFSIVFIALIYSLAFMVKPNVTALTITLTNDKLNLRPLPLQTQETQQKSAAIDETSIPENKEPADNRRIVRNERR